MLGHDGGDGLQFGFGEHRARGVVGRVQHDEFGFGCDGRSDAGGGHFEALIGAGMQLHRHATGHANDAFIGDPEGAEQDDFIAFINERVDCIGDGLLGTVADGDFFGAVMEAIFAGELFRKGGAQFGHALHGRIMGEALGHGLRGGGLDEGGGVEIWLAQGEAYDIMTLGLQIAGLLGHADDGGFFHGGSAGGEQFGCIKGGHRPYPKGR